VAKGFIARGITFSNVAGPEGHQAVALRSSADYFVFYGCCFEGYQDTLYAHAGRQFYRDCTISGTVDFIFGDSLAVFQNCELRARAPMAGQQNTITAQGKKEKDTVTGFSFQNCSLTAESGLNSSAAATYLGRPWKTYSTTVFLRSAIGGHVDPAGWLSWNASNPFESTCVYGEFANSGAGSNTSRRVAWPCVKPALSASQAASFSVSALLPDTSFIPANVPLDANV
jgi:pectinesterase